MGILLGRRERRIPGSTAHTRGKEAGEKWIIDEGVYEHRLRDEAVQHGQTPIPLLWNDTNKGDLENPFVTSRLVVRERTKDKTAPHEKLLLE
eukprot:2823584-Karenia_brevis.AAC.1